jgi:hypothetical protein
MLLIICVNSLSPHSIMILFNLIFMAQIYHWYNWILYTIFVEWRYCPKNIWFDGIVYIIDLKLFFCLYWDYIYNICNVRLFMWYVSICIKYCFNMSLCSICHWYAQYVTDMLEFVIYVIYLFSANKCLMLLCTNLSAETIRVSDTVTEYLMKQCHNTRLSTHAHTLTFIKLMCKVISWHI